MQFDVLEFLLIPLFLVSELRVVFCASGSLRGTCQCYFADSSSAPHYTGKYSMQIEMTTFDVSDRQREL